MEGEKVIQQPEVILPVSKKMLRKPINQVGKAMLLQTAISLIVALIIDFVVIIGLTVTGMLQSQAAGAEFNIQLFTSGLMNELKKPMVLLVSLLASSLLGNTIPYLICAKKTGITFKSLYKSSDTASASYIAKMAVITMAAGAIFSYSQYFFDFILKPFNLHSTSPDALKFPTGAPLAIVLYILSVCIVAPLTEEFIFRGVLLNVFKKYGTKFAIVASALFFGLFHANLYQTPYAIVMGLLLAYIAVETQSIIPTTIIHFVNNTVSAVLSGALAYYPKYSGAIGVAFDGTILVVGVLLFFLWFRKREKISFDPGENIQGISGTKLVFTSWSCIITIIIYIGLTMMTIQRLS